MSLITLVIDMAGIYGEQPHGNVEIVEIKIVGMKTNEDAQYLQYNLLQNENILYARINFPTKSGVLIIRNSKVDYVMKYISDMETYDRKGDYRPEIKAKKKANYESDIVSKIYRL